MSTKDKINKYLWWKDQKMVWTIILIFVVCIQIFAWFKIPVLSTIDRYTIGMLMGFYSPLFYGVIIFYALKVIFERQINMPSWIKLNQKTYFLLVLSIIFISVSTSYYQRHGSYRAIGWQPWSVSFSSWFNTFTSSDSAWAPTLTNGGLIGAFLYAFFSMIISGIGSFILSIILLVINVSYFFTGTAIGFYREFFQRHKSHLAITKKWINNKHKPSQAPPAIDDKNYDDVTTKQPPKSLDDDGQKTTQTEESWPFEDPFE